MKQLIFLAGMILAAFGIITGIFFDTRFFWLIPIGFAITIKTILNLDDE